MIFSGAERRLSPRTLLFSGLFVSGGFFFGLLLFFSRGFFRWSFFSGWLFGKATTIYGGSTEIQNNIIAKRVLGMLDHQ